MRSVVYFGAALIFLAKLTGADKAVTPNPLCPFPSDDFIRSPYEGDCTKYWECYQGQRSSLSCPDGFEFNAASSVCDFPDVANCGNAPTSQTSTVSPITSGPTGTTSNILCPFPSDDFIRFPYEGDCTKYWECYQGQRQSMSCPDGFEFNAVSSVCDFPELAQCGNAPTSQTSTASPTTAAPTGTTSNILCPFPSDDFIRFPYEGDCTKYWECYQGQRHSMSCPDGFEFNAVTSVCDFPYLANCGNASTSQTASTSTSTAGPTGSTPNPLCPFPSDDYTRFPYQGDCSKYWECYQGQRYPMSCPDGFEFNADAGVCDFPDTANCNSGSTVSPTSTSSTTQGTTTDFTGSSTSQTPSTSTSTAGPNGTTPSPLCPFPSDDYTRFPFQGDCSKYWECYQGQRYPMSCPDGFQFNADEGVCDFPDSANCDNDATLTYPTFTTGSTTPFTGSTTTVWTPDPICPYPSEELTYVIHPTNCSLYYECYQGIKYLMSCPGDLVFNIVAQYCDYPANVDCSRASTTTDSTPTPTTTPTSSPTTATPETTSTTPTATPTTTSPTTADPTGTTPNPLCPFPSDDFTRYPFQGDCTKYWECHQGKRYPMSCPDGFEFNAEEGVCDFPDDAHCDSDVTVTYPTFTTSTTSPWTGPTTSTTPTTPSDSTCPYPSDELTYVVYPLDCSKYYECFQGMKYLMSCPTGLLFNIAAEYCDYPENVDCSHISTTSETTVTTSAYPTTTPINVCADVPDGTFLSDPWDCKKFYECVFGKPMVGECGIGLLWNEVKLTCDYPDNVDCNK